jgi:hypothetical protein
LTNSRPDVNKDNFRRKGISSQYVLKVSNETFFFTFLSNKSCKTPWKEERNLTTSIYRA